MNKPSNPASKRGASMRQEVPLTVTRPELLVNGSDNLFREMVHSALAFSTRLEAVRAGFAEIIGLTGIQYTILISAAHLESEMDVGITTIADHLKLSGTFVTTETKKLVKKGFLSKDEHPSDKRRVILRVTSKASAALKELALIQQRVNDVHFGSLNKLEFLKLVKIMPQLAESTEQALALLQHLALIEKGIKVKQ